MRPNSAFGVKWLLSISLLVSMLTNCWEKGAYSRRAGEGGYDKGETGELFFSSGAQKINGQITQSTNLQEENPCVKLRMYNF